MSEYRLNCLSRGALKHAGQGILLSQRLDAAPCSALLAFVHPGCPSPYMGNTVIGPRKDSQIQCFVSVSKTVQKQSCVRTRGVSRTAKVAIAAPACSVPRRINSRCTWTYTCACTCICGTWLSPILIWACTHGRKKRSGGGGEVAAAVHGGR